jgi:hypothetical protein
LRPRSFVRPVRLSHSGPGAEVNLERGHLTGDAIAYLA